MSVESTLSPPPPADRVKVPREITGVISLLLVAAFVMILNETIMGVALPRLMVDFDVSAATAQWLTTGFMLTMAVVIPTTGLILKRFTTRTVFTAAMTLFVVGTALAAFAPAFGVLVAGRIVQAAGTAIMLPLLITTVMTFVPVSRRGSTMGLISIVIAVAPAVGPTFSGLILKELSWRWMFGIVLPIALVAFALGLALVKNVGTPERVRFDAASVVLSALTFGGLIFGLSSIGEAASGEALMHPAIPIVVGVLAGALFVRRQLRLQRDDAALLDLRPFRNSSFAVSLLVLLVSMAALFGTLILLPIFLQNVLGMSTLKTGVLLLPGGLAMGLVAPIVGALYDRVGPRPLVIPGSVVVATGLWSMTRLDAESGSGFVITAHVLLSIGLGLMMTPLMTSALGSVRPELYSHGSAILNTLQQLAGAAGTALFVTVMTTSVTDQVGSGVDPVAAQAAGIHDAFLWGAVISLVSIALCLLVRKPAREVAPVAH